MAAVDSLAHTLYYTYLFTHTVCLTSQLSHKLARANERSNKASERGRKKSWSTTGVFQVLCFIGHNMHRPTIVFFFGTCNHFHHNTVLATDTTPLIRLLFCTIDCFPHLPPDLQRWPEYYRCHHQSWELKKKKKIQWLIDFAVENETHVSVFLRQHPGTFWIPDGARGG